MQTSILTMFINLHFPVDKELGDNKDIFRFKDFLNYLVLLTKKRIRIETNYKTRPCRVQGKLASAFLGSLEAGQRSHDQRDQ